MFDVPSDEFAVVSSDADEQAIRLLLCGLKGDSAGLADEVESNLLVCATTAAFYGRRMGLESQEAFDALAALCLVLGARRTEFFENAFLQGMIRDPKLSAQVKLNRIVEIVVRTIPRPEPHTSNSNQVRGCA